MQSESGGASLPHLEKPGIHPLSLLFLLRSQNAEQGLASEDLLIVLTATCFAENPLGNHLSKP
jgi:hypothetical protein